MTGQNNLCRFSVGDPKTREVRWFATVGEWCEAMDYLTGEEGANVGRIIKANAAARKAIEETCRDELSVSHLRALDAWLATIGVAEKGPGA